MKHLRSLLIITLILFLLAFSAGDFLIVKAEAADDWWHTDWPYRVTVQVSEPGPTSVSLNFSDLFAELGLLDAILDIRSIRVVPVIAGQPGSPEPYAETYSTSLFDAETLITTPSPGEPYWDFPDLIDLSLNDQSFTEGAHALQTDLDYYVEIGKQPNFTYHFNDASFSDWSAYETLTYDLWAEVNESAMDQVPDLYEFELLGVTNCGSPVLNSPALALEQWTPGTVSLMPYSSCASAGLSTLTGMSFTFPSNQENNDYDLGDQVRLLLDNFQLVDQDGSGDLRWMAEEGITHYAIYFDTINHSHSGTPELINISGEATPATISGPPEAGGFFHQIEGTDQAGLSLWSAPITEKILQTQTAPVSSAPLTLQAAKGESEAFQVVVQAPTEQNLPISISDLVAETGFIPAESIQAFRVDTVPLTQLSDEYGRLTDWPDPLTPLLPGEIVHFPAGQNQALWFRVDVTGYTPAGEYHGHIQIGTASLPLTLTVWDFSLPDSAYLPFAAGLDMATLLEAYGGTIDDVPQPCADVLLAAINTTLATYHLTALPPDTTPTPSLIYSLTGYPEATAQTIQSETGTPIWWRFTAQDSPPFPNPAVIDRPGHHARVLPWMAWLAQVDGLYYHDLADWDEDPWQTPFTNYLANGDGYLFYPPDGVAFGYDPCTPASNRLIPSIRLELLREGLEDYALLKLLSDRSDPADPDNASILMAEAFIHSRTLYAYSPSLITATRSQLAEEIMAKRMDCYLPFFTR